MEPVTEPNNVNAIIGYGAGGHSKSVIDAIRSTLLWEIVGLIDIDRALWGTKPMGFPVLGGDDQLPSLIGLGVKYAFVGVGGVADNAARTDVFHRLVRLGFRLPPIRHKTSSVSSSATIGDGSVVLAGAIICADVRVGENVIVNSGAIVDHDCEIGAHSHISTGARLAGMVRVGEGAHIGIGATVRHGVAIGAHAVVGAGSVVLADVEPGVTVVGAPARLLKR